MINYESYNNYINLLRVEEDGTETPVHELLSDDGKIFTAAATNQLKFKIEFNGVFQTPLIQEVGVNISPLGAINEVEKVEIRAIDSDGQTVTVVR